MKTNHLLILIFCFAFFQANAQSNQIYYPKIGEKIVDYTFTDVVNSEQSEYRTEDFRGKWLVLDFWSVDCGTCIGSFPKINKINREFADKVKILSVGIYSHGNNSKKSTDRDYIKKFFCTRAKNYQLTFTCAFDSLAQKRFDIFTVPLILVINPEGVIVAKTWHIDSLHLANLIDGKKTVFDYVASAHEKVSEKFYDPALPYLTTGEIVKGKIDTAFISRSLFTEWDPEIGGPDLIYGFKTERTALAIKKAGRAEAIGCNLADLFQLAYTGSIYWTNEDSLYTSLSRQVVFDGKDTTFFANNNTRPTTQRFIYSVVLPKPIATPAAMRKTLLEDLQRTFGLTSKIELRQTDVYKLIVIDRKKVLKLKTKNKSMGIKDMVGMPGYYLSNVPVDQICQFTLNMALTFEGTYVLNRVPRIINATGIDYNIDLTFPADHRDWIETLKILHKNGLDLIKSKAEMKCIVVSDSNMIETTR